MNIINHDLKKGLLKVKVENPDDLWHLNMIISRGDIVSGRTLRKIRIGSDDDRKQSVIRKPVIISIIVEKIEFSGFSHELRVSGKITEGNDDIPKGSYHSFSLEEGTVITIIKKKWHSYQIKRLEEAQKTQDEILIAVLDREQAVFALLKTSGISVLSEIRGDVQKKDFESGKGDFYKEVAAKVKDYYERYSKPRIILASTAFFKEEVMKYLSGYEGGITLATVSHAGREVFDELLKRPELQEALKQDRLSREAVIVEKVLEEIGKGGRASYGLESVRQAAEAGAVSRLIITDEKIMKSRDSDEHKGIERLMMKVEQMQGTVMIIHSDSDAGKRIGGLGGMAALLRYKVR